MRAVPDAVCFRVTRYCNARCGFCLAPPDGAHPDLAALVGRVDWLADRGVRRIHLCGGEPTLHPELPALLDHLRRRQVRIRLTTNGLRVSDALVARLVATETAVKVSVHGDRDHHDRIVGRAGAFDAALDAVRRLRAGGAALGLQTTAVRGGDDALDAVRQLCLAERVRRWSVLPFVPRGLGRDRRDDYGLADRDKRALRERVAGWRRTLRGRVDVRWLDFATRAVPVMEADGRLVLEGASEGVDQPW
ncbi:MAG: radical SAM protein [Myxococcota bacterium]